MGKIIQFPSSNRVVNKDRRERYDQHRHQVGSYTHTVMLRVLAVILILVLSLLM